ncbi:reverse transcriptase domain-containing protein [Polyangium sp. 6x1]|uniref:reverse transcriptase family protein n=1 Tax=Polyangium sp. 6x1 TaxID=3042689 RepID=UPI0024821ED9|nr:reverse transcriptase domain-containing protein [Polyangium sp. 6x1]MDI1450728.1 reverse transcriptase domain-containing protein [Polyangium sp. 6x1]
MGFWDKVKSFIGTGKPGEGEPGKNEQGDKPQAGSAATSSTPSKATTTSSAGGKAPAVATFTTTNPAPAAATPAKKKEKPKPKDPYDTSGILGLSADEMRKRALKINPYQTAWIGRVDTIPPQSDERTALIDRGLILRGLLTEQQIEEIHRVGDLWLKHHEAASMATVVARKKADEAIEELRRQKAERKAEKKRLAAERKKKHAEAVAKRRAEDIIFLGRGVSGSLGDRRANVEALQKQGLPLLSTPAEVAKALGLPIPRLRWLCYHNDAVEKPHYVYFEVPKRSGGTRLLSAPHEALSKAQQWILQNVLAKLSVEGEAHGFVKGRSTVTNARAHLGRGTVVNLDLSDFFPTIKFGRVRGLFESVGYSPAVATIFALLCTESPRRKVIYDGTTYWVAVGERGLPQGACTSPAISNLVARKLDRRLTGMTRKMGWTYTRYADDLTFSAANELMDDGKGGQKKGRRDLGILLARVRHIVQEEGFAINPKKGRVQHAGGRQEVTGIVVNDKLGMPREEVRKLRAILHAAKKTGLAAQNRENIPHFEAYLQGKIAYLNMVDPERAMQLAKAFLEIPR